MVSQSAEPTLRKFSIHDSEEDILEFYRENGYAVLSDVYSDEDVSRIRSQIRNILETEAARELGEGPGAEFDTYLRDLFGISDDYRSNLYETLQDISALHRLAIHDNVFQMLDLLGIEEPALRDKGGLGLRIDIPSEDEFLSPTHQDVYPMKTENCANFWVPLRSVTPNSGALKVFPGSHEIGAVPAEEKFVRKYKGNSKQGIPESFTADYEETYASLDAGEVLAFHPYLLHQSTTNRSDDIRWTATIRFDDATSIEWLREEKNPYLDYRRPELL